MPNLTDKRLDPAEGAIAPATRRPLRALVVDDDVGIRQTLAFCLQGLGCDVEQTATGAVTLELLQRCAFDLAFLDLRLGGESGLDLLPQMLSLRPGLDVVIVTAYSSVDSAVEAMRRGAKDYLPKPFTPAQIRHLVDRTLERRSLEHRLSQLEAQLEEALPEPRLDSAAPRMQAALRTMSRAAAHDVAVLFRGESGTGKGVLARALHAQSTRRDKAFVVVSCATASEETLASEIFGAARGAALGAARHGRGAVESAEGGTVFLDEVGELAPTLQARLLRFLQEQRFEPLDEADARKADARIVAASNRDLEGEVKAGRFRQDLLYRLNLMEVVVPALRERVEDILPLAEHFVAFFARQAQRPNPKLSRATKDVLVGWSWPGNVRELRNAIERALILAPGQIIEPEVFPERMTMRPTGAPTAGGDLTAEELEREHVLRVLARTATLSEASRILGIDVTTLWRKRKKWGR